MSEKAPARPRRIRVLGWLLIVGWLLVSGEAIAYLVATHFVMPRAGFLFYHSPNEADFDRGAFEEYLERRDPLLGWPPLDGAGGDRYDPSGSRWIPSYPELHTQVVSLYGDSFTYGQDVSHAEAWSNVMSERLGARVANFGVDAYGTDQALLRFRANTNDSAGIVVLGIFPDDVKRNVNRNRFFLAGGASPWEGLKPRFRLAGDALELVPLAPFDFDEMVASFDDIATSYPHEFFVPGSRHGPVIWSFPYSIRILQALGSPELHSWLAGRPGWAGFFSETHPSGAVAVTAGIAEEFSDLARRRGKAGLVVIFPGETSYRAFLREGVLYSQPLLDRLVALEIPAVDLTPGFARYLDHRPFNELRADNAAGYAHFDPEGNRLVADLVLSFMCAQTGEIASLLSEIQTTAVGC